MILVVINLEHAAGLEHGIHYRHIGHEIRLRAIRKERFGCCD